MGGRVAVSSSAGLTGYHTHGHARENGSGQQRIRATGAGAARGEKRLPFDKLTTMPSDSISGCRLTNADSRITRQSGSGAAAAAGGVGDLSSYLEIQNVFVFFP